MSTTAPPAPARIPTPEGFPVAWDSPEHAMLHWRPDRMHFPGQLAPLEYATIEMFMAGSRVAAEEYMLPMRGLLARRINTYFYQAIVPVLGPPEEVGAHVAKGLELLATPMTEPRHHWQARILPDVSLIIGALSEADPATVAEEQLPALVDALLRAFRRIGILHFRCVLPVYAVVSEFDDLYRDLFPSDTLASQRLLGGVPTLTTESAIALWRLSRRALRSSDITDVLGTEAAADVPAALERAGGDAALFAIELRGYLARYGQRASEMGITGPAWIEDPAPVIKSLKDHVTQPDAADPAELLATQARDREAAVREARERLRGYPAPVAERFEDLLRAAQESSAVSEDHNWHIDFRSAYEVRRIVLGLAQRLVDRGTLAARDDVFMLDFGELRAALADELDRDGLAAVVAERRAEMDRWRDVAAPPELGSRPPGPPPAHPVVNFMGKFFGGPPPEAERPGEIAGAPGSSGRVRGTARVVRSLADAVRLEQGDVLVSETTAPPWTPLFSTAAAVVTDTGGVLSHCAVVAREYRIPAVVGCGMATAAIPDGATVEVDGDAGVVRLLD